LKVLNAPFGKRVERLKKRDDRLLPVTHSLLAASAIKPAAAAVTELGNINL
jgi:hypothetical protein